MTYSCGVSKYDPLSNVPDLTNASSLTPRECCMAFDCDFSVRLTLFIFCSSTTEGRLRILSCSLVEYALGVNSTTVTGRTTR